MFKNIYRIFLALTVIFTANYSSASPQDGDYVFILGARGNPYWKAMEEGINETAKTKGIKAIVYQTETDRDAEGQLNICQTAIQLKPKIIVMQAINPSVGINCYKEAIKAGIVVADLEDHLTMEEAEKAGINLAFTVGSDNFVIGQEAAKFVAKRAGTSHPKILILEGATGSLPSQKRVDGFKSTLKTLLPSAEIVGSISAEWDRMKALDATAAFLQREPNLDLIYTANDMMALGAVEAVRNGGKKLSIGVVGVDGTGDARKAVMNGDLTATVGQLPYLIGSRAVELAFAAVHNEKFEKVERTPTPVLTLDFLRSGSDPLLKYIR